jgi:DNA-directed RNA polymerase subunit RPC12/RpoP
VPAARSRREHTVYECGDCGQRLLGEQRCGDCATFARRVGPGGPCPHCSEPVAVDDLTGEAQR